MNPNSTISRKDIRDALVRAALKDEAFRESLLANPKFAVERTLGKTLMSEEIQKPETVSDEQLEDVAGGTFDNNSCNALIEATVIVG
jgi:hypothetical protein